jgi:hypothetical protein
MIFSQKKYTPLPDRTFKATKTITTSLVLTSGSPSVINFNNLIYNTDLVYSSSTSRVTAGSTDIGSWNFVVGFGWSTPTALHTLGGYLYLNGALYEAGFVTRSDTTSNYFISSYFLNVPFSIGDYVDFRISSNVSVSISQAIVMSGTSFFKGFRQKS